MTFFLTAHLFKNYDNTFYRCDFPKNYKKLKPERIFYCLKSSDIIGCQYAKCNRF